ncbi:hypothetical protein Tco_0494296 [Tanacetum coccineum]
MSSQADISESAGPSVGADKGKAPMPDLEIPAEFLAEDAQARQRLEEEQAKTDYLTLMMQVVQILHWHVSCWELMFNEDNFIERMTAIKERKKRALADLNAIRALKWCAAHNGTITMKVVKAMSKQQLIEEYETICRRLEKDRLLSAQYNLFRPKPAITEPPSKRQRVERASSQPSNVPAATTPPAMIKILLAAMDSAGSHHELGISPFADSDDSSSPSPVSTDHIPVDVLFEPTSGGINAFFLGSDEDEHIGIVGGFVDKLPDDEIVDPRVKVETMSESASSPPRSRRKHRGVRSDDSLWAKPVEDFFSSESESDDDMENYIPPIPYGAFKDWEIDLLLLRRRMNRYFRLNPDVDVGLDLWRDVNLLCQSLHSDDVEDFWRTQDEWVVSSWKLYPKSSVHVLDLTNEKTVLTVPPSYCRDVVVAGNIIQTVQDGLRQAYECLASAPIACTARQMVFSSPWLTAKKESGSPLQTALVCNSNPLIALASPEQTATGKDVSNPLYGCDGLPKTVRVFQFTLDSCSEKLDWLLLHQDWTLLFFAAGYIVSAGVYDAAVVPAGSSSSVPADYVSAGHVLLRFIMDDPNITMEEYIRLEEEKAQRHGRTFNWQTASFGKVKYCEDEDDCFTNFETKFSAIVFDDTLTSDATLSCEPTVSPLNKNEIDFRISFDESKSVMC